jgi:hypothetical protein
MAYKQYKNVYTILEKVKKGEIQSHYSDSEGLFGKINFYKKEDLIKPHLHYIDEWKVESIVEGQIKDQKAIKEAYQRFASSAKFGRLDEDQQPDFSEFYHKVWKTYEKIPGHLKYDIHKLFYNKIDKLDFEERTDKNKTRFRFLEKANNPVGKIMSEGSNLKSSIFARNIMLYYAVQLTMMEYTDPQQQEQIKNGMDGKGDPEQTEDALNDMFDNQLSKNMLERAMQEAQDTCKMMDDCLDRDVQERLFDQANKGTSGTAGKVSPDYLRTVTAQLARVKLSMGTLKDKIKRLLDKSASYFSSRKITTYEDLFNSSDISGLQEYELLHPKLRKFFAEDILIKDTKSVGKIDVYVDVSGSMSSGCGVKSIEGSEISRIEFAKSIIAKLKEMDMLNDVYVFDNYVKKYRNDMISIAMLDCGGGTTINNAVSSIERNGINALVITDAEDHCGIYSEKAFFIGVKGCRFSHFGKDVLAQYSDAGQIVVFDGQTIHRVGRSGQLLK